MADYPKLMRLRVSPDREEMLAVVLADAWVRFAAEAAFYSAGPAQAAAHADLMTEEFYGRFVGEGALE